MNDKLEKLKEIIRSYESVLVAFSGGVDSAFVLKVARDVLGRERVKAVTAKSASLPEREFAETQQLARLMDVEQIVIETREMDKAGYTANQPDRCFFCKETLYETLAPIAEERGFRAVCNGTNTDDLGDWRPGLKAAREFGVLSPLVEAGMNKEDVRFFSRAVGLPVWDKPAMACLSSRIPYGEKVTPEKLSQVERAENFLKDEGFPIVRVRHHGQVARIEVAPEMIARFFETEFRERVAAEFKSFGFLYVTVDLEGYRLGSLNSAVLQKSAHGSSDNAH